MPLIKRQVLPVYISRKQSPLRQPTDLNDRDDSSNHLDDDYDLAAVSNTTLCGALQQLGSLLSAAKHISQELQGELDEIVNRTGRLSNRIAKLTERVESHNPRDVPIRKCTSFLHIIYSTK